MATHEHDATVPLHESDETESAAMQAIAKLAMRGSLWTLVGFGAQNVITLGRNVAVAHLLFPEALGLMGIVTVVLHGIQMCSDVGVAPSVIKSESGYERRFLRTAWIIQMGRGTVVALIATGLAWPMAIAYEKPQLLTLIPVAAIGSFLTGVASTNMLAANKSVRLARITALNVSSQIIATVVAVTWAWLEPTVWALVGAYIARLLTVGLGSHILFPRPRMQFEFDRAASREILTFGKWIFVSSLLGFLASALDRLVLGKLLTSAELGTYMVAYFWANAFMQVLLSISNKVLFPVYTRVRELDEASLRAQMFRLRAVLLLVVLPPIYILVYFGDTLITLLYDDRYVEAGWMLQLLAAGTAFSAVGVTAGVVLLALGDSFRFMLVLTTQMIFMATGMALGWHYVGLPGLIAGVAFSDLLNYPVMALCIRRYGVWLPRLDFLCFAISLLVVTTAYWFV